ncbi:hypothetical protein F511_33649 [Dorcoceras hygrometricum]|uniref:Uncharacterized protein n=1 Tax=Dorcoceras hygrometricum TaxID=472368 RepID=A0A2Z7AZP7_9LAMI|nr:hypothetical protein F511_33649 [Dorcoceras hygrometricum]
MRDLRATRCARPALIDRAAAREAVRTSRTPCAASAHGIARPARDPNLGSDTTVGEPLRIRIAPPVSRGNRHFTVGGGRLRQSGPRPETIFLRSACTRRLKDFIAKGFSSKSWPKQVRRKAAAAATSGGGVRRGREAAAFRKTRYPCGNLESSTCVILNGSGIQLAVGPQPLWLRNHNSGLAQRIMILLTDLIESHVATGRLSFVSEKSNAIIGVVTAGCERLLPSCDGLTGPEYHGPMIYTG